MLKHRLSQFLGEHEIDMTGYQYEMLLGFIQDEIAPFQEKAWKYDSLTK